MKIMNLEYIEEAVSMELVSGGRRRSRYGRPRKNTAVVELYGEAVAVGPKTESRVDGVGFTYTEPGYSEAIGALRSRSVSYY